VLLEVPETVASPEAAGPIAADTAASAGGSGAGSSSINPGAPGSVTEAPLVAYRFCRPDDIPLLVRAVNECWDVHDPAAPRLTVESFRHEMKVLDAWPSNSMLALAGDEPVAVLIGTKRTAAVRVLRVGVKPGHEGQGHGRHLVTSLSQKLAVLGPPRLVAEVRADDRRACDFLEALGWRLESELVDRLRPAPRDAQAQPVPEDLVIPVTVAELDAAGALEMSPQAAWGRQRETLLARADHLVGAAVSTPDRVEAYLLAEPVVAWDEDRGSGEAGVEGPHDVVALGCQDPQRAEFLLGLLFRWLSHTTGRALRIPRLAPGEVPLEALAAAGFEAADRWLRYAAEARPL
jgi:ribosomal protein S18 acetylase RimI-like enzyme